ITLIIPTERHAEEDGVLARIRRGEIVDHFETVRQRKDGSRLSISLTVSPIRSADGTIIGASKIARDITERRRTEAERVLLAEAVEQALSVVRGSASAGRHVIDTQLDEVGVDADPVRLDQIILNLMTNAVKYTPAGRTIRVRTFADGDRGVLRVEDEGVGIA